MNRYEKVAAEYGDDVVIEERDIENEGLYSDGYVWIKKDMTEARKACILAEEIGHHILTVGDITELKMPFTHNRCMPQAPIFQRF